MYVLHAQYCLQTGIPHMDGKKDADQRLEEGLGTRLEVTMSIVFSPSHPQLLSLSYWKAGVGGGVRGWKQGLSNPKFREYFRQGHGNRTHIVCIRYTCIHIQHSLKTTKQTGYIVMSEFIEVNSMAYNEVYLDIAMN